jgi:predicted DNA-binding transcriptional regulator YafY
MESTRQDRTLEIFFRGLRGEDLSVHRLADEYGVSTKSVTRSLNDLKSFLADHRDLVGNTELRYSSQQRCYRLYMDGFLTNHQLFAVVEVLIGARAFSKMEMLELTEKLRHFTTPEDRPKLNEMIRKELYHYAEVKHDCESVQALLWQLVNCIVDGREITIEYYRMDRKQVTHRLRPASVMFSDYYFYLIAFKTDELTKPLYFRIDRIKHITEHRTNLAGDVSSDFDEGLLRRRSLYMWPGKLRTIQFEFTGPSVQAVLDKLPTARVVDRREGAYLIEAEVYGDGIKMWLLSQGPWVKVVAPNEFVDEMRQTISQMADRYAKSQ